MTEIQRAYRTALDAGFSPTAAMHHVATEHHLTVDDVRVALIRAGELRANTSTR